MYAQKWKRQERGVPKTGSIIFGFLPTAFASETNMEFEIRCFVQRA